MAFRFSATVSPEAPLRIACVEVEQANSPEAGMSVTGPTLGDIRIGEGAKDLEGELGSRLPQRSSGSSSNTTYAVPRWAGVAAAPIVAAISIGLLRLVGPDASAR
jgi:hypothetical protein